MGKLIVELPEKVHRELKKKAAESGKTIKEIITELVDNYLLSKEREAPSEDKGTGLCGSWEYERTAEEIIDEIKNMRRWFLKGRD